MYCLIPSPYPRRGLGRGPVQRLKYCLNYAIEKMFQRSAKCYQAGKKSIGPPL